jgi:DNA-binding beta-propeller fold protein YncE
LKPKQSSPRNEESNGALHTKSAALSLLSGAFALVVTFSAGCAKNPADSPPPTITPASAAVSPPVTGAVPGVVRPLPGPGTAAVFDPRTAALTVLGPADRLTVFGPQPRTVTLPSPARALAGDGAGRAYLATRGGYLQVDLATGAATRVEVIGQSDTDFTAIAVRADGRLVLGSADGAVLTLAGDAGANSVSARLKIFAHVDGLVAQGNSVVVLDRGQTSVTEVDEDGTKAEQALRAGEGATTIAADSAGRVLVADTRGGALLVYGTEPLILRQAYPVHDAPYGLAGSSGLAWVSQTATNTVVGYDLSTGIPVEKVRYRTVQQPDILAYDDASGTLYVVSGSGGGVQVIEKAAR